jgi:ribose 1,5-bisphosphokinase
MLKGTIFYIIGSSGVGKDTIINELKNKLTYKDKFIFAKRFITRPNKDGNEKHIELSLADFKHRINNKLFSLNWEAHENYYGIGIELEFWTASGYHVVVNGSREYLDTAKKKYPNLKSILIDADKSIIYERLIGRKRESVDMIDKRIQRNNQFENTKYDLIIKNDSTIDIAVLTLVKYINTI